MAPIGQSERRCDLTQPLTHQLAQLDEHGRAPERRPECFDLGLKPAEEIRPETPDDRQRSPRPAHSSANPPNRARELDVRPQLRGDCLDGTTFRRRGDVLDRLQLARHARCEAVRQQADRRMSLRTVEPRDLRAGRLLALVRRVPCEAASSPWMERARGQR